MNTRKRRAITDHDRRETTATAHFLALKSMADTHPMLLGDAIFQGGTCLHLAHGSGRWSVDLDFVARSDLNFNRMMEDVRARMEEEMSRTSPGTRILLSGDATEANGQNACFYLRIQEPHLIGKTHVKVEFWRVAPELLQTYRGAYSAIHSDRHHGRVDHFPVSETDQLVLDKLIAVGSRAQFKIRDAFDLWHLSSAPSKGEESLSDGIARTLKLYSTTAGELRDKWEAFLRMDDEMLSNAAEKELKPFLPASTWDRLVAGALNQMIQTARDYVRMALEATGGSADGK